MKTLLQENCRKKLSNDDLRVAVKRAWEVVEGSELEGFISQMPERCQALVEANGLFSRFKTKLYLLSRIRAIKLYWIGLCLLVASRSIQGLIRGHGGQTPGPLRYLKPQGASSSCSFCYG
jgi:hypothetical protein